MTIKQHMRSYMTAMLLATAAVPGMLAAQSFSDSRIDFPVHYNFTSASSAYGMAAGGDKYYNDATYNVVYNVYDHTIDSQNGGDDEGKDDGGDIDKPSAQHTVFFDNTGKWSKVYLWAWDKSDRNVIAGTSWPGLLITDQTSEGYYYYTFTDDCLPTGGIIWSDGQDTKAGGADLTYTDGMIYDLTGATGNIYSSEPVVKGTPGDVNADGTIDISDYALLVSIITGKVSQPAAGTAAATGADANQDGTISDADLDALRLLIHDSFSDNLYGLRDNIQEGVILHCFDWTAAQVEAEITNIARAGFSAVQLSPVHEREGDSPWYMAYQPYDFKVGNSIANVSSLTSLCNAAHEVGVKVIVDVIANHTNGDLKWVAPRLQDHSLYHNDATKIIDIDYSDRWSITHNDMGIQDLDTSNKTVQGYLKDYIAELKSCGVDGIRFDAAKHIGLPSEGDDFWQNVPDAEMYNYGEILDSTGGDDLKLFAEYQKYISITDNKYGNGLADSFSSGYVPSSIGVFNQNGANTAKLVYWGESHDTYSNENGESKYKSQNAIDRAYAIAAGNNGATALYFSRPFETEKDNIMLGVKGSTHFTAPEVAEVNHCHNLCAGEPNYYVHTSTVGAQVRKSGCIMATGNGKAQHVSFDNGDGKGGWLTPGLYTDKVAGGQFTVTAATISGYVGNTGIAVIYGGEPAPPVGPYTPSVTASEVSCFIETDAQQVSIWAWDKTENYTGGEWDTKPQMQLMGVNAQGRNIFKWTYTGSLTTQPEHVIFVTDGSQSVDIDFTNHGYYIGGVIDHVVQPDEQPDVPQPTFSLTVGDATVLQVQNATLQLCLTTQLLSVAGLQCLITLPDGVTLTDADVATDRCPGHTVMTTATRTGYALTLLDKTNAMLVGDEGAIVTLSVDASRTAALGKAALKISDVMVTSVNANSEVTTYRQDDASYATLMIADPLVHADINADGRITVADVTTLIDTMQLGTAATAEQIDRADVNADGQLSEADLVLLIQLLLAQ